MEATFYRSGRERMDWLIPTPDMKYKAAQNGQRP